MKDQDVTETNHARLAREAVKRQRGELPTAQPGSVAESFGYSATDTEAGGEPKGEQRLAATEFATAREYRRARDAQARREWLEWRRTGIGASDIASILEWGFGSPYSVWATKVGLVPASAGEDSELFEFGHRMEPVLKSWFEDHTGLYVGNEQQRRQHPDIPIALATIDGEVFDHPPTIDSKWADVTSGMDERPIPLGGYEAKTATAHGWKADDPIPDGYQAQGQWQMLVNGWERMWFAVLHQFSFRVYELHADHEDQQLLLARAQAFWTDHVLTLDPPPIDSSAATTQSLRQAYPGEADMKAWLPDLAEVLGSLREAMHQERSAKRTVALYKNVLKEAMGNATEADFGDGTEVTWTRFNAKRLDHAWLKLHYPDAYDASMRQSASERFTVRGARHEDDD